MATKLNWGIIAAGSIARRFAADLKGSRTGVAVAVAARQLADAERFAGEFGIARAHGGYEGLLADPAVEAVYIATPHPWHAEWAIKAAQAGKHILCEKPLTLDLAEARRVSDAARRHKVLLMEAFMYRCHPQTARLVELVRAGAIGELRLIRASFNVVCEFNPEHRLFKRALGGGAILDLGCYPVSLARLLAGAATGRAFAEPRDFHATGRLHPLAGTDEYATTVLKFPGGIIAELSCGTTVRHDISAQVHGTTGWLDVPTPFFPGLEGGSGSFHLHRSGASPAAPEEFAFPGDGAGLYACEADAVADAVARGDREVPQMPVADTIGNMAVLDAWRAAVGVRYD